MRLHRNLRHSPCYDIVPRLLKRCRKGQRELKLSERTTKSTSITFTDFVLSVCLFLSSVTPAECSIHEEPVWSMLLSTNKAPN